MCGRVVMAGAGPGRWRVLDGLDIPTADFEALPPALTRARYNVAPTSLLAVAHQERESGAHRFETAEWGFVPPWARAGATGKATPMINARAETVAEKPAFRSAFASRRAVVPVTGFYEWQRTGGRSIPSYFAGADGEPLLLAGILGRPRPDAPADSALPTVAILTTRANATVAPIHDRMPVILPAERLRAWLDPGISEADLEALLAPAPDDRLTRHVVSTRVNDARQDDPSLIEPVDL